VKSALICVLLLLSIASVDGQDASTRPSFSEFLAGVRTEALARGIREATLDVALVDLVPEPVVIARDRAQPEQTLSLETYIARRLTARTVTMGRDQLQQHRELLDRIAGVYGVPSEVIVAVWGLESNFGRFTGTYPTIRALATLAYDARRSLFRAELLDALAILDRGDATVDTLKGSWAGAMGQPQFMPSSFLSRAVDFDGDGRADIWSSLSDVFASTANYLREAGWVRGQRWGREVTISKASMAAIDREVPMRAEGCRAIRSMTVARPLDSWKAHGVTLSGGAALPGAAMDASLVRGSRRHFLAYGNYGALLSYNCSHAYALSVGLLADRMLAR
jgi:membrane-bound lytic murein transglycosylase B